MGLFFGRTTDVIAAVLMILAQWQIGRGILVFAGRAGWRVSVLRPVLNAIGALLAFGFVISLPLIGGLLPVHYQIAGGLRAVTFLWLVGSTGAWMIYRLLRLIRPRTKPDSFDPARRVWLARAGVAAAVAPCSVLAWGTFVERTNFRTREIDIAVAGLPVDLEGLRLVQLSDIHLSAFLSEKEFARVIDASNELRPHVTLVTGDLISMRGDPLDACLDQLARLRADAGVVGCLGNHEIFGVFVL
jgi:hypothetical protein